MNITVYTINDCKFSQAEKAYLKSNNIPFKEKNLESNREFLTEMLQVSNNFAGTPVTKVEKDDGETVVLKGFSQAEFDKALGVTAQTSADTTQNQQQPNVAVPQPQPEVQTPAVDQQATPAPASDGQTQQQSPQTNPGTSPQPPMNINMNTNQAPAATAPEAPAADQGPSAQTPTTNTQTSEQPPAQQPTTATNEQTPAQQDEQIGPISLSADVPEQSKQEQPEKISPPEDMQPLAAPEQKQKEAGIAPDTAVPQQATPAQTPGQSPQANPAQNPDDQLNSVLQNLQNQVGVSQPEEEDPSKKQQPPQPQS